MSEEASKAQPRNPLHGLPLEASAPQWWTTTAGTLWACEKVEGLFS